MIRFYVLAIDTPEPAKLSWHPVKGAGYQMMTEEEFRRIDIALLADECVRIISKGGERPLSERRAVGDRHADDNLFPDADPLRANDGDPDPDGWRSEM